MKGGKSTKAKPERDWEIFTTYTGIRGRESAGKIGARYGIGADRIRYICDRLARKHMLAVAKANLPVLPCG